MGDLWLSATVCAGKMKKSRDHPQLPVTFHCSLMDPSDPSAAPSAELEAALAGHRARAGQEDTWVVWLGDARVHPGRFPSIPTAAAFALYRRWCLEVVGQPPLAPFEFARLMLTRFRKAKSRYEGQVIGCYATSLRSAERLRAASREWPPTAADRALFTFTELRKQTHPKDPCPDGPSTEEV